MHHRAPLLCLSVLAVAALVAGAAQSQTLLKLSAGTGFVINNEGNLVTNAHVVRGCQSISVVTPRGEKPASLVGVDAEHDLAVLKISDAGGAAIAPLRWNIRDLKVGDAVTMIGFPGQAGVEGRHTSKKTSVTALKGPEGEPLFIQLSSVAEHGNSGGPVLDATGNVIAVITGIAQTYKLWPDGRPLPGIVAQSDVAITLTTLRDFLYRNAVPFYESVSSGAYSDAAIEQNALKFTLSVRCVQG
jgi:S1-C subfamily serine protease